MKRTLKIKTQQGKRKEKDIPGVINPKKAGVAISVSDRAGFRAQNSQR